MAAYHDGNRPQLVEINAYPDSRGFFAVPWLPNFSKMSKPVQLNVSQSTQGVVRGMHWQTQPSPLAKYVYCANGKIFDQVIDLRKDHPRFGEIWEFELGQSEALYVPIHFAHGFQCLTEEATVVYLQDGRYCPEHERAVNASTLTWPLEIGEQSDKDRQAPSLEDISREELF